MSNPFVPIQKASMHKGLSIQSQSFADCHRLFILGNRLPQRWSALSERSLFQVGETDFGLGMNFLLTWKYWNDYAPQQARLHFFSCVKNPYSLDELKKAWGNQVELAEQARVLINQYPILTPGYHHLRFDEGRVSLTLMLGDVSDSLEQLLICGESILESSLRSAFFDAWYVDTVLSENTFNYDAIISNMAMLSKPGTTLTAGTNPVLLDILPHYGFVVEQERTSGDENIYSTYAASSKAHRLKIRHTPWHVGAPYEFKKKSAIILGAGLSGCFTAKSLAQRGWQVTLLDELAVPGLGGSGNTQAVLFPKLSAYKSPLTQFMLTAFLFAHQEYQNILKNKPLGELNGSLLLAYNAKEKRALEALGDWLNYYPELGELVDCQRASELSGLMLNSPGLFIPLSGWLNSPALCQELSTHPSIRFIGEVDVHELNYEHQEWSSHGVHAPVLILANGSQVNQFDESNHLPIKSIHGQMTAIHATAVTRNLKIPLSAEGHVLPELNGRHWIGASYEAEVTNVKPNHQYDAINKARIDQLSPHLVWSDQIQEHWAGMRASTPDYLPLVGQLPVAKEFINIFSGLSTNSKRWIAKGGLYYPGLYACAGFGSRGITSIPLCAEWLAGMINNEMSCLPRYLIQAISPARFLRRDIIRK